jgi:hypothetical protein
LNDIVQESRQSGTDTEDSTKDLIDTETDVKNDSSDSAEPVNMIKCDPSDVGCDNSDNSSNNEQDSGEVPSDSTPNSPTIFDAPIVDHDSFDPNTMIPSVKAGDDAQQDADRFLWPRSGH